MSETRSPTDTAWCPETRTQRQLAPARVPWSKLGPVCLSVCLSVCLPACLPVLLIAILPACRRVPKDPDGVPAYVYAIAAPRPTIALFYAAVTAVALLYFCFLLPYLTCYLLPVTCYLNPLPLLPVPWREVCLALWWV